MMMADVVSTVSMDSDVVNECSEGLYRRRKPGRKQSANWIPVGPELLPEPKFCPEAIAKFVQWGTTRRPESLTMEVRQHLAHEGWRIEVSGCKNSIRYRYTSPNNKVYLSLCQLCHELDCSPLLHVDSNIESPDTSERQWNRLLLKAKFCSGAITEFVLLGTKRPSETLLLDVRQHLLHMGWKIDTMEYMGSLRYKYTSPDNGKIYMSLRQLCHDLNSSRISGDNLTIEPNKESTSRLQLKKKNLSSEVESESSSKRRKVCKTPETTGDDQPTKFPEPNKRMRPRMDPPSSSKSRRRTILSLLIDNNAELIGAKVQYRASKATGKITTEGVECDCCHQVFTLTGFEAHSGRTNHRPAANIVLEDGRSLSDLQKKMVCKKAPKTAGGKQPQTMDEYPCHDFICTLCHDGGDLILCDNCPSVYHGSCLGLEDVPDGKWFCPSCRCHICGQRESEEDDCILTCNQCLQQYHVGCLEMERKGSNFCSNRCEDLYLGIEKIVGKPIVVGEDNLTWTLLKPMKFDNCDSELLVENHSKLNLVLDVMHECFEPANDYFTGRDITKDIIFGRESSLPRLNFLGFYSILVERNDEVITVANLRIFDNKAAELPLVATRFQYRRQGMCSVLMDELEKQLTKLGVEKIVLPSAQSVLNTWKNAFGFSEMTVSERRKYLDSCTFVYFHDAIMCHKVLDRELS